MDFEALQTAWRSNANSPNAAVAAYVLHEASATVRRRRTALRGLLVFAGVMLIIPLALVALEIAAGQSDAVDFRREWALIPFTLIPFVLLVLVARRHFAHLRRHPVKNATLIDTFRALIDENAAARARIRLIGGAVVLFVPLLVVLLSQLGEVGKMEPEHMLQAGLLLGGALAVSAVWMAARYLTRLVPERRQLEGLIRQYESASDAR